MVESIEHVATDLQFHLFHEGEVLSEAEIQIPKPGCAQRAGAKVARTDRSAGCTGNWDPLERRRIEVEKSVLIIG